MLPDKLRPLLRNIFGVLYTGVGDEAVRKLSIDLESPTKLISVAYLDGMPLTARRVVDAILAEEQK